MERLPTSDGVACTSKPYARSLNVDWTLGILHEQASYIQTFPDTPPHNVYTGSRVHISKQASNNVPAFLKDILILGVFASLSRSSLDRTSEMAM